MARGWHGDSAGHAAAARKGHHHFAKMGEPATRGEKAAATRRAKKERVAREHTEAGVRMYRHHYAARPEKASKGRRAAVTRSRRQRNPVYSAMFETMTRSEKPRRRRSKK